MNLLYDENTENCLQEPVMMQEVILVDGILTARIPVSLKEMSENGKEAYYPYEDRPEMIFADDTGECQMTFQMIQPPPTSTNRVKRAASAVRSNVSRTRFRVALRATLPAVLTAFLGILRGHLLRRGSASWTVHRPAWLRRRSRL